MIQVVTTVCLVVLAVSAVLCVGRIVRSDSIADRALALDALLVAIVAGVGVEAVRSGSGVYLDVLLVVALVAFIGTAAVGRFIERRGA